jgi:hypothetical protein
VPAFWFAQPECRHKFCCVADAVDYESMRWLADLIASPPADNPHAARKERLMMAYQQSTVLQVKKLLKMPDLRARQPSDLLAAMIKWGRRRVFSSVPCSLQAAFGAESMELATMADQLW